MYNDMLKCIWRLIKMSLEKKDYRKRLIDDKIDRYLKIFGAISIQGPKWCGKTWTSLKHANSVSYMTEKSPRDLAKVDPKYIFNQDRPQLIDEWQLVPSIWDAVRHECDSDHDKGKFILTGSTSLSKEEREEEIFHSGTGRIAIMKMNPMSLYESGDSTGDVSIEEMFSGNVNCKYIRKVELDELAKLIIRGGWPENIDKEGDDIEVIPRSYIESVITRDINERKDKKRDSNKMRMLIRSLSRNETTIAGNDTIVKDIEEFENTDDLIASRLTVADYVSVLDDLYLTANQEAFSINYRSSKRIGKSPKRHLVDPSLACASLDLTVDKLLNDHETFGLLFEALVERDLRIYMDYLDGHLYHFRDNVSGDEVDSILEFRDGEYAAVEIKLSDGSVEDAKKSLMTFYKNVNKKPKFMCIIVGHYEAVIQDKETGIYIIPITSLRP
ncbi:MAG TPA: ATPase [Clostridiales bacterium]|jgi:predicted AAA+ superfamily ATPase|nr:ATPase [Clostridiales bacterium]